MAIRNVANQAFTVLLLIASLAGCSNSDKTAICESPDLPDAGDRTACTQDSDCTFGLTSRVTCEAQCRCPGCYGDIMNQASAAAAGNASSYDCTAWQTARSCARPPCPGPPTLSCSNGHCVGKPF